MIFAKIESVREYRYNKKLEHGEWKVRWYGWSSDEDTWEPWQNLEGDAVRQEAAALRDKAQEIDKQAAAGISDEANERNGKRQKTDGEKGEVRIVFNRQPK